MVIPVYMVLRAIVSVVKYIYRRKDVMQAVREIEISAFGITKKGKGFIDTGNSLFDDDSPVIFCTKDFAMQFISGDISKIKFKKIVVGTVNGRAEKTAFKIESIKIYNGTNPNIYNNVTACIVNDIGEGYDVILHPALLKGEYYENLGKVKKVS
jgi:hypothetical protein